jgi:hypothetical protein
MIPSQYYLPGSRWRLAVATCAAFISLLSLAACFAGSPNTGTTGKSAPSIATQPQSVAVTVGQTATFTVVAMGSQPLSYQWQKNQANIAGANSVSYTTPATTSADNATTFGVIVSNGTLPNAISAAATLTVSAAPVAPSITTQPQSVTVTANQTATFTVVATGTAPLSYQWQKNHSNLSGANSAAYTTPATSVSDSGSTFDVIVSNGTLPNATSAAATLTVNASAVAPSITTQPQSAAVTVGQTATFSVVATGTAPLSYQWQKNQANISGANSASYTTPATSLGDNGSSFDVIVSNGTLPNATSANATLTVNPLVTTSSVNVLTYHNDNGRTGQNLNETALTTSNVNPTAFGKLATMSVSGNVDAEPLYVSGLSVGGASHNAVFVATEEDMVYAFDADTFAPLWSQSVANGESPAGMVDSCTQVEPNIGVTSTPVIDLTAGTHGTIFVVAMTQDAGGNYHQRLHALDLTTGAEQANSPETITATYTVPGTSTTDTFNPKQYKERAGLLLMNGTIYLAWASHCDDNPYQGWVMAYNESTLQPGPVLNIAPVGANARTAIWMANTAMAADTSGNIFFLAANGVFGDGSSNPSLTNGFPTTPNYGNAFMKLSTAGSTLTVDDYFAMFNANSESNADQDLGSGGAIVLPDLLDSSMNVHHLAVGAGKDGYVYVVNRDSMGKFSPTADTAIYQKLNDPSGNGTGQTVVGGVRSMPAYFNGTVYYGGTSDTLKAFTITNAKLSTTAAFQSSNSFGFPGCTPSISANGNTNGIVWCISAGSGTLSAYNASNLTQLYSSPSFPDSSDVKFVTPMIANGKVYVGVQGGVVVFGLLP